MAKKKAKRMKREKNLTLDDLKEDFYKMHGDGLLGLHETAEVVGVSKHRLGNWIRRKKMQFPKPLATLKMGPVWNMRLIMEWRLGPGLRLVEALRRKA